MLTLGIETTCDETACAVVRDGREILSNVVVSQTDLHAPYGGVFPELACRRHLDVFLPVLKESLERAGIGREQIDLIAVAMGPGLIGALLLGLNAAKALAVGLKKPFVGVNHVEAHLYAAMMGLPSWEEVFPAIGLVVSGGHTLLVQIPSFRSYIAIGATVDDAVGEAFDKVAVLLGLSYPGGPAIEALAESGDPQKYRFPTGMIKGRPWDFSFSGLKTSLLYALKGQNGTKGSPSQLPDEEKPHLAASFQRAALGSIVDKTLRASREFPCRAIFVGGGVSQNRVLRTLLTTGSAVPVYFPPPDLCLDNGAMIAGLGTHLFQERGISDPLDLEPMTRIPLIR
jgi:N6-L-threonylcarbamoyladenine synthase